MIIKYSGTSNPETMRNFFSEQQRSIYHDGDAGLLNLVEPSWILVKKMVSELSLENIQNSPSNQENKSSPEERAKLNVFDQMLTVLGGTNEQDKEQMFHERLKFKN